MAYKVIDDETALQIYEAVQKHATRSFESYDRSRQLPRTKITGELVFYLDELLSFATDELHRDPAEVLAEVVDAGMVAWFGNLEEEDQLKLNLCLDQTAQDSDAKAQDNDAKAQDSDAKAQDSDAKEDMKTKDEEITALKAEIGKLSSRIDGLMAAQDELKRHNMRLLIENEELIEQRESSGDFAASLPVQPAFLDENAQTGYTQMTSHLLKTGNDKNSAAHKQSSKKKRRK